jgi:predicted amidohydrolase
LLQARAIENLSYVTGVNRVGTDGKGHTYSGNSALISPKGERLFHQADTEIVHTVTLDAEELAGFRQKFPAYMDADAFDIKTKRDFKTSSRYYFLIVHTHRYQVLRLFFYQ